MEMLAIPLSIITLFVCIWLSWFFMKPFRQASHLISEKMMELELEIKLARQKKLINYVKQINNLEHIKTLPEVLDMIDKIKRELSEEEWKSFQQLYNSKKR